MTRAPHVRRLLAVTGTLALLLVVGGCGGSADGQAGATNASGPPVIVHERSDADTRFAGTEVEPAFELPRATLTGDDGTSFDLAADLERPVTVFFFGYTQCPDVCSLVMADLTLALARLPEELRAEVEVVFVTSDPARDDPAILRSYLRQFNPDFIGLTGSLGTIVDVAEQMGIAIERGRRLPSGGYEVGHGAELIGYAGDEGVLVWGEGVSVDDLSDDLARLATAAAEGDRAAQGG